MKIKLGELNNALPALEEIVSIKLPVITSFRLTKLITQIQKEIDTLLQHKNKLIEQLGEKTTLENGQETYHIPDTNEEAKKEFYEEMNKLLNVDVDINFGEKLSVKDFKEDSGISPKTLLALEQFIKFD